MMNIKVESPKYRASSTFNKYLCINYKGAKTDVCSHMLLVVAASSYIAEGLVECWRGLQWISGYNCHKKAK
jgi:hypothetical protein